MKNLLLLLSISLLLVQCSAARKELKATCLPGILVVGEIRKDIYEQENQHMLLEHPKGIVILQRKNIRRHGDTYHAIIIESNKQRFKYCFRYELSEK